jgi:hypothetical protein
MILLTLNNLLYALEISYGCKLPEMQCGKKAISVKGEILPVKIQ